MLPKFFKPKRGATPPVYDSVPSAQDAIQEIGRMALEAVPDQSGKVLLYAEVEDGVISADMFSQINREPVRFRFAPQALKTLIYEFWETGDDANGRWATMTYLSDAGRFNLSFEYPETLNPEEDLSDRRPKVVRTHFGDAPVDYSSAK